MSIGCVRLLKQGTKMHRNDRRKLVTALLMGCALAGFSGGAEAADLRVKAPVVVPAIQLDRLLPRRACGIWLEESDGRLHRQRPCCICYQLRWKLWQYLRPAGVFPRRRCPGRFSGRIQLAVQSERADWRRSRFRLDFHARPGNFHVSDAALAVPSGDLDLSGQRGSQMVRNGQGSFGLASNESIVDLRHSRVCIWPRQ